VVDDAGDRDYRPSVIRSVPALDNLPDGHILLTDLGLAGFTLLLLVFSSVLFDQTMQDYRGTVEGWWSRLTGPWKWLKSIGAAVSSAGAASLVLGWASVLAITGVVYALLEPGAGWNSQTAVMFVAVIIGTGILTYVYSGLEVLATERQFGAESAVRLYIPCLVIAIASVLVSRMLDLQPGFVYGFVASAVVLGSAEIPEHQAGKIDIVPVVACLVLSVVAWLLTPIVRDANTDGSSFALAVTEAVFVMTFVGGIEGLFLNMVPLRVMDGGKIWLWNKAVYLALGLVTGFLFWYVLLNREREYFDGLQETPSLAVVLACVGYALFAIGTWAFFRFRYGHA